MGLGHSKTRSQVIKVAPMPAKEVRPRFPCSGALYGFQSPLRERSSSSFASLTESHLLPERCLPPLQETWYARYPTVPDPYVPNLETEDGELSIIRRHPPQRPRKLEPIILSKDIPLGKFSRRPTGTTAWTPQALERGPAVLDTTGRRRQHLHKTKMLEKRQEAERKRRLRQEVALDKSRMGDLKAQQMFGRRTPDDTSGDEELLNIQHNEDLHVDPWPGQRLQGHELPETHPGQIRKVESWLLNQPARRDALWDTWSTDSDSWKGSDEGKLSRRPALVRRTKTERLQLFNEFFDQEF